MIRSLITWKPNRVIIDVDTQRYFFADNGRVCVRNHRWVLANILRVLSWGQPRNIPVISTVQISSHNCESYNRSMAGADSQKKITSTLRERRTYFEAGDNTDLHPQLLDNYDQVIVHKRCFDPFEEPRADRILSELQVDEFILIGAVTEGALRATAIGLLKRNKNVTVVTDATGSPNGEAAEIALRQVWVRGGKLIDTETLTGTVGLKLFDSVQVSA